APAPHERHDGEREREREPDDDGEQRQPEVLERGGADLVGVATDPVPPDEGVGVHAPSRTTAEIRATSRPPIVVPSSARTATAIEPVATRTSRASRSEAVAATAGEPGGGGGASSASAQARSPSRRSARSR